MRAFHWLALATAASLVPWLAGRPSTSGGDGDLDTDVDGDVDGDADGDTDTDVDADWDWPTGDGCTKVDILFVIDDSGSMSEEQSNLAANFPRFIEALEAYRTPADTQLEYRVGVTSTSRSELSTSGTMTIKQGGAACEPEAVCGNPANTCECPALSFEACTSDCPGPCYCEPPGTTMAMPSSTCDGEQGALVAPAGYSEPWIDGPGAHVATAFADAASLGTSGCGLEMPLYAVEHALSPALQSAPTGPNSGFLRPDALLMVIILTDEDDCSTDLSEIDMSLTMDMNHPFAGANDDFGCTDGAGNDSGDHWITIEHYLEFLDGLMGQRSHWAVAVIAGERGCSSSYGDAVTAHRLQRFVEQAGTNAVFSDICAADLAGALDEALDKLQVACDEYVLI